MVEINEEIHQEEVEGQERLVSVVESIRYRKRAQAAEKKAGELESELEVNRAEKERLGAKAGELEMENKLLNKLVKAGAVDVEAALLLAKVRLGEDGNVDAAVEKLKKEKGYLFENSMVLAGKTAGVRPRVNNSQSAIEKAAKNAAKGPSRASMMEYLKLRRSFK